MRLPLRILKAPVEVRHEPEVYLTVYLHDQHGARVALRPRRTEGIQCCADEHKCQRERPEKRAVQRSEPPAITPIIAVTFQFQAPPGAVSN